MPPVKYLPDNKVQLRNVHEADFQLSLTVFVDHKQALIPLDKTLKDIEKDFDNGSASSVSLASSSEESDPPPVTDEVLQREYDRYNTKKGREQRRGKHQELARGMAQKPKPFNRYKAVNHPTPGDTEGEAQQNINIQEDISAIENFAYLNRLTKSSLGGVDYYLTEIRNIVKSLQDVRTIWRRESGKIKTLGIDIKEKRSAAPAGADSISDLESRLPPLRGDNASIERHLYLNEKRRDPLDTLLSVSTSTTLPRSPTCEDFGVQVET
ncbi:hypothetical protein BCR41DRAFT_400337 [Lobosporangium transversale]|uniref:Uncharacterized protein n=1 Tax=Lobosporangium transversale TaxID=64571 RepID=A0A1Y2GAW1_9FUNG|nr:hypothetical protein BCR41DRAFT_400337 [Lobosporangium transversale]ORZ05887.1 hypothetical protein BCR41DRAFT_400337 [Lobosporangium transversale]|eukprot:XP_021877268.1 hypothetical protein BCR41DRAFT_400337 [Lobosporangium transversale]